MWKRAFIVLLSVNLVLLVFGVVWLNSFPRNTPIPKSQVSLPGKSANIQLAIGQDAINTYLEYALSEQPDIKQIFSYARVGFDTNWACDVGIRLSDRIVPFHLTLQPSVSAGNLDLQIVNASIGDVPIPTSVLLLVLKHAPWPDWIALDIPNEAIDVNFTKRPPHPYGVQIVDYSLKTKLLTMVVSIIPKSVMPIAKSE